MRLERRGGGALGWELRDGGEGDVYSQCYPLLGLLEQVPTTFLWLSFSFMIKPEAGLRSCNCKLDFREAPAEKKVISEAVFTLVVDKRT